MANQADTAAPRLKKTYSEIVIPKLIQEFGYKNHMEVPVIEKIVINMGVGESTTDSKKAAVAAADLALIAGQKPVITRARKAIAQFKVRENMPIGAKVTLRKNRMYEFMDRLVNIVLPRLRDFHGVKARAFDKQGSYSIGLNDQTVFPEITFEDSSVIHGLQVVFVVRAQEPAHSKLLLSKLGMPFEKENK